MRYMSSGDVNPSPTRKFARLAVYILIDCLRVHVSVCIRSGENASMERVGGGRGDNGGEGVQVSV